MKSLHTIIFLLLFVVTSIAQTANPPLNTVGMAPGILFHSFDKGKLPGATSGETFVVKDFVAGGILLNDGQQSEFAKMNYDAADDVIVVVRNGEQQVVVTQMVRSFFLQHAAGILWFDRVSCGPNQHSYFQRLVSNSPVNLYKKLFIEVQKPTDAGVYADQQKTSEVVRQYKYFIEKDKACPVSFKNKKTFIQLFPEQRDQLSQFIRDHGINFKHEDELISLVKYLGTLQSSN